MFYAKRTLFALDISDVGFFVIFLPYRDLCVEWAQGSGAEMPAAECLRMDGGVKHYEMHGMSFSRMLTVLASHEAETSTGIQSHAS